MRFVIWALTTAMLASGSNAGSASSAVRSQQPQEPRPSFSVKSELVMLNVTVRDKSKRYLDGLQKEAFSVFEDGQAQPLRFFMNEDAPVTIGLLIDNSGSMQPNRNLVVAAATAFAETSNPQDDIFALAFDDQVRTALATEAPFTNDPAVLREALQRTVTTRGRTALYDAVARGLEYVEQGSHDRKVLVIVSDGSDNASSVSFEQVFRKMQTSNVVVYAVALADPIEVQPRPKRLKDFAEVSGGELFQPDSVKEVTEVLQRIANEIRHTYVMAYEPADGVRPPGLRRLRVSVRTSGNQKVSVRTRAGYLTASDDSERRSTNDR